MGVDLQKWNPFRFARGSAEGTLRRRQRGQFRCAPPEVARLLQSLDPFGLLPSALRGPFGGAGGGHWFGDFSPSLFQPRVDIVDDGDALRVTAELPGMEKEDLEVIVEDGFLVLRGDKRCDKKQEEEGCYRLERAFGSFQRDRAAARRRRPGARRGEVRARRPDAAPAEEGERTGQPGAHAGNPLSLHATESTMNETFPRRDVVCALIALGATDGPRPAASAPGAAPARTPPPVAGRMLLGVTVAETELVATGYRASKMLRADVFNDRDEKIGKVDDLLVSTDGT